MSEEFLRQLLERLNSDAEFRERVQNDWESIVEEFDLSPAELVALGTNDEDALRRLAGAEVAAYRGADPIVYIRTLVTCYWCPVKDTPGSRRHCGGGGGPAPAPDPTDTLAVNC
jgi:hypothetical protein